MQNKEISIKVELIMHHLVSIIEIVNYTSQCLNSDQYLKLIPSIEAIKSNTHNTAIIVEIMQKYIMNKID